MHWFIDEYKCSQLGCHRDDHTKEIDWDYYYDNTGTDDKLGITECKKLCSADPNCGSFEWTFEYCSWWKSGICQYESDAKPEKTHFMTCRKQKGRLEFYAFIDFIPQF